MTERGKKPPTIQIPPRRAHTSGTLVGNPVKIPPPLRPPSTPDMAAELETRQVPRLEPAKLAKLAQAALEDEAAVTQKGIPSLPPVDDLEIEHDEPTMPRELPLGLQRPTARDPIDSDLFTSLPHDRRAAVLARFFPKQIAPGALLIRQGETGHPLYLVTRGLLEVRSERAGGEVVTLDHARDGEFVGELALLSHTPSTFHVIAATPAEVLALAPKDFYDIAGAFPALWAYLKDISERRGRDYDQRLRRGG